MACVQFAWAQTAPSMPPAMQARELASAPVLDGNVAGDAAWDGSVPASGFWQVQPDDGQPASQETQVFIGYLRDALYIGVIAYDQQPDAIIVADSRRDSDLSNTDSFQVIIDGLLDRQNGYVFGTSPAGLEYDGQVVREGAGRVQFELGRNLGRCGENFRDRLECGNAHSVSHAALWIR
jgi:hypothetical protein